MQAVHPIVVRDFTLSKHTSISLQFPNIRSPNYQIYQYHYRQSKAHHSNSTGLHADCDCQATPYPQDDDAENSGRSYHRKITMLFVKRTLAG
mmetsp:Transcript_43703/g.72593  ORF Transcript_43703/g.72593 Transcript_43703/m.72593 type:complete len:92 (-) Transcript_43703:49-324(-)